MNYYLKKHYLFKFTNKTTIHWLVLIFVSFLKRLFIFKHFTYKSFYSELSYTPAIRISVLSIHILLRHREKMGTYWQGNNFCLKASLFQVRLEQIKLTSKREERFNEWNIVDAFATSLKQSKGRPKYSFYDGPPFATGLPHYGHILAGTIKVSTISI